MPAILAATEVSKSYGVVRALDAVDFEVRPGEIVALAGENGSGKSTLARILAGVIRPDSGTLAIDGSPATLPAPHEALRHGIALVTQEPTSLPAMSLSENVLLGRPRHWYEPFRRRRAARLAKSYLVRAGVRADPLSLLGALRPGEREKVEVARALATDPRLLILDEVTSRLGQESVEELFGLIRDLRDEGSSCVIITHRLPEICEIADRTVVLRDGHLVGELTGAETTEDRVTSMMVGRDLQDVFQKSNQPRPETVLRLDGLRVRGTGKAISLTVRAGEVVGLAGLVGSGRSELLETIAGLRRSESGTVSVCDRVVRPGSIRDALDAGIALVPEDRHAQGLVLHASIRLNLAMQRWRPWAPANRRKEDRIAKAAVTDFGIKSAGTEASVDSLSGGNQQKVVLARCIDSQPRVLLLDEPTRGVDIGARGELFRIVGDMLDDDMAVLMASSDMLEILGVCDRVIILHDQEVAGVMERSDATESRIASLAAGGRADLPRSDG